MWQVAGLDPNKYNELTKLSVYNYYIYIENLEAEKQRQSKAQKK